MAVLSLESFPFKHICSLQQLFIFGKVWQTMGFGCLQFLNLDCSVGHCCWGRVLHCFLFFYIQSQLSSASTTMATRFLHPPVWLSTESYFGMCIWMYLCVCMSVYVSWVHVQFAWLWPAREWKDFTLIPSYSTSRSISPSAPKPRLVPRPPGHIIYCMRGSPDAQPPKLRVTPSL